MATRDAPVSEIERLQDENRALMERLAALENELDKRDGIIHENIEQKEKLSSELKESKREVDQLQHQLEEAEEEMLRAKGQRDKLNDDLEEINVKYREDITSVQSSVRELQDYKELSDAKIEEQEENHHMIMAELKEKNVRVVQLERECQQIKEEKAALVVQLERECQQIKLESSSRQANLNQALLHNKQVCSQLEARNEELEARNEELEAQERILVQENETLESRCMELSSRLGGPCQLCRKREHAMISKISSDSKDDEDFVSLPRCYSTPVTPFKSLPEQTEVDRLNEELLKKHQKYECLFENYQMVSEKNTTLKKEAKESEKALYEMQGVCDSLREERDELEIAYKESQRALSFASCASKDSTIFGKNPKQIHKETESLKRELDDIQTRHNELLAKKSELENQLQASHDNVTHLHSQVSSLKVEKIDNESSLEDARKKLDELMEELRSYRESSGSDSDEPSCDQHMQTIAACKSALDKSKKERDGLRERLTELEKYAARLEEENAALGTQNSQLHLSISDCETHKKTVIRLESELEAKVKEIETLQSKIAVISIEKNEILKEATELKKGLKDSQSQTHDLKNSVAKLKNHKKRDQELVTIQQKEIETERAKATDINQELAARKKELEIAKNVIKRYKHDIETNAKSQEDLENQLLQCRMRIDELEVLNFELESSLVDTKTLETSLVSKSNRSEMKIEELNRTLRATEQVLYEKEHELNETIKSNKLLKKEKIGLEDELDQLSQALMGSNDEIESLRCQMKHYHSEIQGITSELSDLEAVHLSCGLTHEKLESENEYLKKKVTGLKEEKSAGKEELSTAILDAQAKSRLIEDLEETLRELEIKLQTATERNEKLSSRSERQESELLKLTEHTKLKSEQLRQTEREITRLKSEINEHQQSYSNDLEHSEARYYKLKEENDHLRCEKRDLSSHLLQVTTDLQDLENWKRGVVDCREEWERKIEELKNDKAGLRKQVEGLKAKLKEAKHDLKTQKKKYEREPSYAVRYAEAVKQHKLINQVLSQPETPTSERREGKGIKEGERGGVQQYSISSTSGEGLHLPLENILQ